MSDVASKRPKPPPNLWLILALGVLAIASSSIFIRYAQAEGVPSLLIATTRVAIAALVLTPMALRRYRPQLAQLPRADWLFAIGSGVFLAAHFATWITSLEYTSVLLSTVLVTTSPIWVALFEIFFLKARLNRLILFGIVMAILGGVLIAFGGIETTGETLRFNTNDLIGAFLALLGALTVSGYFIIGRKLRANLPLTPYIWLVYGCAALALIPVVALNGIPLLGYSSNAYLFMLATALIPQLIGHTTLNYAVGYLPATMVSLVTQLEPIGSAILAFLLFAELPFPLQVVGSGVILAGVMLSTLGQAQSSQKSKQP